MPHRIAVVGVALVREGAQGVELLAARRTEPPALAGGWELPGGKVDPGETEQEAAIREIDEELGVGIVLGERVPGPDGGGFLLGDGYRMGVYLARIVDGQQPWPREQHDEIRWLALHQWDEVAWLEGDLPPVRAVVAALGGSL